MTTEEDKAKAEKLAAAKKRVEQLKKQKAKKAGGTSKKDKKDEKDEGASAPDAEPEAAPASIDLPKPDEPTDEKDEKDAPATADDEATADEPTSPSQPTLSQQSKLRSTSFRNASITAPLSGSAGTGPLIPEVETAPDIYRKQVTRIDELEKENKKLAKEATDAEKRWQKAEEELSDLREADGEEGSGKKVGGGEVEKLKAEIAAIQRQNAQLQARRHGSSPSISMAQPATTTALEAQLASKSATIESMELEISTLRAQVERLAISASSADPNEQVSALEEKLARAERAAGSAQRELVDLKRNLERASEKAVREGSERASAETKARALEKDVKRMSEERDEAAKKAEALEKKAAMMTTLHREQDARGQTLRKEKERVEKELEETREKLDKVEAEATKLRKRDARDGGGMDDDAVDELEDEERKGLARKIRELEAENSELRRGIWHEKRKEMQVGPDDTSRFTDVNLADSPAAKKPAAGGFGDFFNSITGGTGDQEEGFLDDDDDVEFDAEAFRKAQEEDAKKRIERVKKIKRGLKNWEGFRLDLVEVGSEGVGPIFAV